MLPQAPPVLNGVTITHEELRAIHEARRNAIASATARYCLDGPRLLHPPAGERCEQRVLRRCREGHLCVRITVQLPEHAATYTRNIRLVPWEKTDAVLKVEVAREKRQSHT